MAETIQVLGGPTITFPSDWSEKRAKAWMDLKLIELEPGKITSLEPGELMSYEPPVRYGAFQHLDSFGRGWCRLDVIGHEASGLVQVQGYPVDTSGPNPAPLPFTSFVLAAKIMPSLRFFDSVEARETYIVDRWRSLDEEVRSTVGFLSA